MTAQDWHFNCGTWVSSYFGGGVLTPQWDLDLRVVSYSGFAGSTAATVITVPKIKPGQNYHLFDIPNRPSLLNPVVNHEFGHVWYLGTIQDTQNTNGFSHSPFGGNNPWFTASAIPPPPAALALAGVPNNTLLSGFQTYGNVTAAAGSYVLTEEDNAGIFQDVALSVDAEKLRFHYRFTTPGDGDFLAVSVNCGLPIFIGSDTDISRDGAITAEVDLMQFAGETVRLDIKLVSRGQPGAVVTVDQIEILTNDDQDGDGLTNAFELSAGMSPFLYDTDGDGLDDNYESSLSHTNPLLADSDGDGIPDGWEMDRRFNADLAADALLDPDGDGSSTLLEFALGTDPRVNSRDGIGIVVDENGYLTLTTSRNPAATGLQLHIAVSGDLATWYSDAAHVTILANTPTLLKARDNIPLGSAARRFIRLEVGK